MDRRRVKKLIKDKRKYRSEVLIDFDDFLILSNLSKGFMMELEDIKSILNISHKGLLVHLKRLISHDFITVMRSDPNYKCKLVRITDKGRALLKNFYDSPKIETSLREKAIKKL